MGALLFGKLPAHGDFVSRGLDPAARDRLDRWLSASLAEAGGQGFEERFDRAPPWRFAIRDAGGWAGGAVALSVDAAGRRFPLYAACTALEGRAHASAVAGAVEALLFRAVSNSWDADRTHAGLAAAPAGAGLDTHPHEGWWIADDDPAAPRLGGLHPPGLLRAMLEAAA